MKRAAWLACALVTCASLAACAPALVWTGRGPDRRAHVVVTEQEGGLRLERAGASPQRYDAIAFDRLVWTPRGVLVPAQRDGAWWIVDGAGEQGPFDEVGEVVRAGPHAAFVARTREGWRVSVDGRPGAAFDDVAQGISLDGESGSVAYVVTRADGQYAVHDDAIGPACETVEMATLGAKGRMLVYVDRGERDRILVDHADAGVFDRVLELVVAPDEAHWAALVAAGEQTVLVHDGTPLASSEFLTHLRISDDGAHVACLAPAADGASIDVIRDGAHVAHHRRIDGEGMRFAQAEAVLVFLFEDSQGMRVAHGHDESERYEAIEPLVFAPHRWGFVGRRLERSEVVVDGRAIATEEWAGTLALAAHGDGYAYVARVGDERFVVTSRGRWPVPRLFVDSLVLDDEGRHWAALVPEPSSRSLEVWVDGVRHGALDDRELGGAISIQTERTLREVVREIVRGELDRALRSAE